MEEKRLSLILPYDLKGLIKRVRYVSFDIFDTAILRLVLKPEDVFTLVDKYYTNICGGKLPFDFRKARIYSEKKAREKAWFTSNSVEITLNDIYKSLIEDFNVDIYTAKTLRKIEMDTEMGICVKNEFIYSIYKYCLDSGKDIIFLSDMYLPKNLIERILEKCDYNQYKKLYLSSVNMATKSNGGLYELMLRELNCKPNEILHIGDNHESDIKMAGRFGLITYHYEKCIKRACKSRDFHCNLKNYNYPIEESIYNAIITNKFYSADGGHNSTDDDFWYSFGYKCAGILFFSFTTWLIEKAKEDKVEKLYFLSRDGFIMKKVYDILSSFYEDVPPSEYMYASRRSLNIPGIIKLDDKSIDFLVSGTSKLRVEQFLERIGLASGNYISSIKDAGFRDKRDLVVTGEDYAKLKKLLILLSKDILDTAARERELLLNYLDSIGIFKNKKFGVVDIGWHGTLQYSLNKILKMFGHEPVIKGYYLGTWHKANDLYREGINMNAYICEFGQPKKYHDILKLCVEIFEFMHTAPHGSVVRFGMENGTVKPIFDNNDCDPIKIKKAKLLQRGALDFIEALTTIPNQIDLLKIPLDLVLKPISRVLMYPSPEEAAKLGDLEHAEGFGDVYVKRYIAKPPGLIESIFNPPKFIREYKKAFWRKGFIKRFKTSILLKRQLC